MQCGCQNLGQAYQNCYSAGRLKTIEIRSNIHFAIFSSGRRFIFFAIFLIGKCKYNIQNGSAIQRICTAVIFVIHIKIFFVVAHVFCLAWLVMVNPKKKNLFQIKETNNERDHKDRAHYIYVNEEQQVGGISGIQFYKIKHLNSI